MHRDKSLARTICEVQQVIHPLNVCMCVEYTGLTSKLIAYGFILFKNIYICNLFIKRNLQYENLIAY